MPRQTLIASGTHLQGSIKSSTEIVLNGNMEGEILCSETVTIEQGAFFHGLVNASVVLVKGTLHGQVNGDLIKIMAGGQIHGEIKSFMLIIEPKGMFEGTCIRQHKIWDEDNRSIEFDTENILL